jgi:transposase
MNWKNLLESVSESVNDELRLRNEYLVAENRILRSQIDGRVQLTDSERKELAQIGAKLGKQALAEIATIAQADTILAWHRKFAGQKVDISKPPKSVGRPRVDPEIEEWVIRMARENRSWGYDRIQGSLKHLGYTISDQTIGNILKRHGIPPAPERKKTVTWGEFVRPHLAVLLATDFFNSEAWNGFGLIVSYLLSFIYFGCHPVRSVRRILHQQVPGIRTFLLNSLKLSAHAQRWDDRVKTVAQSGLHLFRPGIQPPVHSGFPSPHQRARRPQGMSKVVVLPVIEAGPIRDGPIQSQDLRRVVFRDNFRKAA